MFCSKCGTAVADDSQFCSKCGQSTLDTTTSGQRASDKKQFSSYEDLTPELREKLKAFQKHTNMACLECGYSGLMGVTGTIVPWFMSWWVWIPIFALIGLTGVGFVGAIILGLIIGFVRTKVLKKKTVCPSCDTHLTSLENI